LYEARNFVEVSSIFDPLGFVALVLLEGKIILQELCRNNVCLDDPVPAELQTRWLKWKLELRGLENHATPRCIIPWTLVKLLRQTFTSSLALVPKARANEAI